MSEIKWCIECKKQINGEDLSSLSFLGLSGTNTGLYCKNSKCTRYGLITVIYLEQEKKAPEDVKSNDPLEDK